MDMSRVSIELCADRPFRSYPNKLPPKIYARFDILTRSFASGPVNRLLLEGTESVLRLTKQSVANEAFGRQSKVFPLHNKNLLKWE